MYDEATAHLRKADPVMARIIDAAGPCGLRPGARGDDFTTLLRAIAGQQLSTRAAETIWLRVCALHTDARKLRPEDVLTTPDDDYRAAGLSRAKIAFMKDLAARVQSGDVNLRTLSRRGDEEIVETLVKVKGIGRWTVEMFLIFKLGRPDVWPVDDLGIRNAVSRAYGIEPTKPALGRIAEPWRPWRSVASWYLWRSLTLPPL